MKHRLIGLALVGLVAAGVAQAEVTREQLIKLAKENNVKELKNSSVERGWYVKGPHGEVNIEFLNPVDFTGSTGERHFDYSAEPMFTGLDAAALYSSPDTIKKILAYKLQEWGELGYQAKDKEEGLFGEYLYGATFVSDPGYFSGHDRPEWGDPRAIGTFIEMDSFITNPIAVLAEAGELEKLKTFVGILESMLKELKAESLLSNYLSYPVADFCSGKLKKHFIFGGNALILALLNGHKEVAEYLLEKGARPSGSSIGSLKAYLLKPDAKGYLEKVETIDVEKLIKNANLKVDMTLARKNLAEFKAMLKDAADKAGEAREQARIAAEKKQEAAEQKRIAAEKAEKMARLKKLSKPELCNELKDIIMFEDTKQWETIEMLAQIDRTIFTENVPGATTSPKPPVYYAIERGRFGHFDWKLIKYLFKEHKDQKRPLNKNDIEAIIAQSVLVPEKQHKDLLLSYLKAEEMATDEEIKKIKDEVLKITHKDTDMEMKKKMEAEEEYRKMKQKKELAMRK